MKPCSCRCTLTVLGTSSIPPAFPAAVGAVMVMTGIIAGIVVVSTVQVLLAVCMTIGVRCAVSKSNQVESVVRLAIQEKSCQVAMPDGLAQCCLIPVAILLHDIVDCPRKDLEDLLVLWVLLCRFVTGSVG